MTHIGPYEIRGELGRGGMGVVYRAYRADLAREFALKVIRPDLHGSDDAELVARFRREAQAAARLADHPGIVAVRDLGEADGRLYLAMDIVEGRPLDDLIFDGDVGADLALQILEQAARAVHQAHEAGFLHRDLKPANILVTQAGDALVTDFGLAGLTRLEGDVQRLTASNMLIGTPEYMSPEQAFAGAGQPGPSPASDVWALGATLYEALAGRTPFEADTTLAVLTSLLHDDPPPLRNFVPEIPPEVEAVVMKCLEREPADRYPSARALAEDCARLRGGESPEARPVGALGALGRTTRRHRAFAGAAAGVVVVAGALGVAWWIGARSDATGVAKVAAHSADTRAAESLAVRAEAFRRIEEATRDAFALLEDQANQRGGLRGEAPAARATIAGVLDGCAPAEQQTTAHRAWRLYLQILSGELEPVVLTELAAEDPEDPVAPLLAARLALLRYAAILETPTAYFATTDPDANRPEVIDTEQARELRERGVEALRRAAATPLWAHLQHGPEGAALLEALQALPHGDWALVGAKLAIARDDPWWRLIAGVLSGYALAMEQRFGEAADLLEKLGRARARADLLLTAGMMRLNAARQSQNARGNAAPLFQQAIGALQAAWDAAPHSTEAAAMHAAARIELAALRAEGGADTRPELRRIVEELDARASRVRDAAGLEMERARSWLIIAQLTAPRGENPAAAVRECVAACRRALEAGTERAFLAHQYRANAWGALASWQMGGGGDAAEALGKSIAALGEVLQLKPGDSVALNDRGTVRLQFAMYHAVRGREPLELLADAAADFERAGKAAPAWSAPVANLTDVYLLRAQWLRAVGQSPVEAFEAAIAQVTRAIAAEPATATYRSRRGLIRSQLAEYLARHGGDPAALRAGAVEDFRAALDLQPRFVESIQGLADLLLGAVEAGLGGDQAPLDQANEAITLLEQADSLRPGTPAVLNGLARAYFLRGQARARSGADSTADDDEARRRFDALVRAFPDQPTHRMNRSYAYVAWGLRAQEGGATGAALFTMALEDLDRTLALNPRMPPVLHRKGLCLHALGRHREAVAAFEAALALNPDHPETPMALAAARRALAEDGGK